MAARTSRGKCELSATVDQVSREDHEAEGLRLIYVALTRAREHMFIFTHRSNYEFKGLYRWKPKDVFFSPSVFVHRIRYFAPESCQVCTPSLALSMHDPGMQVERNIIACNCQARSIASAPALPLASMCCRLLLAWTQVEVFRTQKEIKEGMPAHWEHV